MRFTWSGSPTHFLLEWHPWPLGNLTLDDHHHLLLDEYDQRSLTMLLMMMIIIIYFLMMILHAVHAQCFHFFLIFELKMCKKWAGIMKYLMRPIDIDASQFRKAPHSYSDFSSLYIYPTVYSVPFTKQIIFVFIFGDILKPNTICVSPTHLKWFRFNVYSNSVMRKSLTQNLWKESN